jgi:hypothetical protein
MSSLLLRKQESQLPRLLFKKFRRNEQLFQSMSDEINAQLDEAKHS